MQDQRERKESGQRPVEQVDARPVSLGLDVAGADAIELVVDRDEFFPILGEVVATAGGGGDGAKGILVQLLLAD